ncbi:uncharacterized protein [Nicotiana tomentosiformis]|uniref:uncharacterized protein n=1 Tax=Nicotiana tomentosiformis TaxID=4098 RepID=UPI00388CA656
MSSEALLRLNKFTKLFPVHFSDTPSEDPHDYLDPFHEVLWKMGIVESNVADFAVFQITGSAREKFLPITLRDDYHRQFECLQQGSMNVTHYETYFVDLARHALLFLPTNRERVRRFIDGLTYPIRLQIAKETEGDISFQTIANVARWIEVVLAHERGQGSDERPRHFSGFSGTSSSGRGTYGGGQPPRPFHSAL